MTTSIENLYNQFAVELHEYIRRKVRDDETAKDILQDIFLKLFSNSSRIPEPQKLRNWVFAISRNAVIDHFRKNRKMTNLTHQIPEMDTSDIEPDGDEFSQCFLPFIQELPPLERDLLTKVDIQGKKQKILAEEMNISYSGLKSKVQRSREKVKKMFEECCQIEYDSAGFPVDCFSKRC